MIDHMRLLVVAVLLGLVALPAAADETGTIRVLCDVRGAHAFVDGVDRGPTPLDIRVQAGEHALEVRATGYQTAARRVAIAPGDAKVEKLELRPAVLSGVLRVVEVAPDAEVAIDGVVAAARPVEVRLVTGTHALVVRRLGYMSLERRVRIEPGQTLTVRADLRAIGKLRVLSVPSGAGVGIDGVEVGKSPLELEVAVGDHVVRLEVAGYRAAKMMTRVDRGQVSTVRLKLDPE
jgi:hypothetical protein